MGRVGFRHFRVPTVALLRACLALRLELTPMLNADIPVRVRVESTGTPPMLIGEVAEGLHHSELDLSVGVIQSREQNIQSVLRVRVFQKTSRINSVLRLWRFQHASEQRD